MSNLEDDMGELFGLVEKKVVRVIEPKEMKITPPKVSMDFDVTGIDFGKIANSSEFKRFIYFIRTGTTFRGSNAKLDIELKKSEEQLNIVRDLNKGNFRDVMNEFKQKLVKVKQK